MGRGEEKDRSTQKKRFLKRESGHSHVLGYTAGLWVYKKCGKRGSL